jgi:hypothetical protein
MAMGMGLGWGDDDVATRAFQRGHFQDEWV